jgi:hypothetical protein
VDEVTFGCYTVDGRPADKMRIAWYDLGDRHGPTPRLEAIGGLPTSQRSTS